MYLHLHFSSWALRSRADENPTIAADWTQVQRNRKCNADCIRVALSPVTAVGVFGRAVFGVGRGDLGRKAGEVISVPVPVSMLAAHISQSSLRQRSTNTNLSSLLHSQNEQTPASPLSLFPNRTSLEMKRDLT